jgi:hypothetical protein
MDFFVDHHGDTIAVFLICMGMGVSSLMDIRVAMLIIIGYYAMMTLVYIVTLARGVFKISFAGLGPTEIRVAVIIANIAVWALDNPLICIGPFRMGLFTVMGVVMLAILFTLYLTFGEIERRKLARLDPPRTSLQHGQKASIESAAAAKIP